jgi:glycosyltransferase involved in cell wall biosynthesis
MDILHLSALPVWSMDGKGGMPSLRETLRGHIRAGHRLVLVLPKYDLFNDIPTPLTIAESDGYAVELAPCRWLGPFLVLRRAARWFGGGKAPPYALRWLLNLVLCLLLTASLTRVGLRVRRRQKTQFDLVYAHNQYAAPAGWLVGRLFRIPNVTRLYGTFLADLMKKPLVALRYPVAAVGYLVPHSLLICANDGTRGDEVAQKLRIDRSKFRFWQNGVDLPKELPTACRTEVAEQFSAQGVRLGATWVFTCSRLAYWKRIDRMIRALQVARRLGDDCQLLVAGSGVEEQRLRALARELRVENDVVWLGAVDHEAIWQVMHVADVFIITNDVTNRCNPLFEAICAGLPIVSVKDPSTADLLRHEENALLAEKDDTESLGRFLHRLSTDPKLARSLSEAQATRRSQMWSWEERMQIEVAELESLVRKQQPAPPLRSTFGRYAS